MQNPPHFPDGKHTQHHRTNPSGKWTDTTGGVRIVGASLSASTKLTEVDIINSTITDNRAPGSAGGLTAYSYSKVLLHNTILAGNKHTTGGASDLSGPLVAASSHNLFGFANPSGSGNITGPGNLFSVSEANLGLTPLGDYGGPTQTHALLPGSPAIDAGDDAKVSPAEFNLAWDQRGSERVYDVDANGPTNRTVDIGAFEFGVFTSLSSDGILTIDDTYSHLNDIEIKVSPTGFVSLNDRDLAFESDQVTEINIFGSDGDDTIDISQLQSTDFPALHAIALYGGEGNDTITGSVFADLIFGNSGDDTLDGGAGNDHLDGGTGADNLSGGTGSDSYTTDASDPLSAPQVDAITALASTQDKQLFAFRVIADDVQDDYDLLSFSATVSWGTLSDTLSFTAGGVVRWRSPSGGGGTYTFDVTVTDSDNQGTSVSFSHTVTNYNETPPRFYAHSDSGDPVIITATSYSSEDDFPADPLIRNPYFAYLETDPKLHDHSARFAPAWGGA